MNGIESGLGLCLPPAAQKQEALKQVTAAAARERRNRRAGLPVSDALLDRALAAAAANGCGTDEVAEAAGLTAGECSQRAVRGAALPPPTTVPHGGGTVDRWKTVSKGKTKR